MCAEQFQITDYRRQSKSQVIRPEHRHILKCRGQILVVLEELKIGEDLDEQTAQQARKDFRDLDDIASAMGIYSKMITVENQAVNIEVPADQKEFSKYIHMEDYDTGKELTLDDSGVYINAKLSELLDVQVGDQIEIELDEQRYQVKIAGIYKLYFKHYLYMSNEFYEKLTGQKLQFNSEYFVMNKNGKEKQVTDFVNKHDHISSVNFESGIAEAFVSQMESLNSVVIILIVCAGSLAFIVLYNLTNIVYRRSQMNYFQKLGLGLFVLSHL